MNKRGWALGIIGLLGFLIGLGGWQLQSRQAQPVTTSNDVIDVYKNPQCGCCNQWVEHLRAQGFTVKVHEVADVAAERTRLGVPAGLGSCHTATVSGYVIEGHVPAADIRLLLREKPPIAGLAVAGMPVGAPGMEGPRPQHYQTVQFSAEGKLRVFADHPVLLAP